MTLDVDEQMYPDDVELAAYIHEQLHWLEEARPAAREAAIAERLERAGC